MRLEYGICAWTDTDEESAKQKNDVPVNKSESWKEAGKFDIHLIPKNADKNMIVWSKLDPFALKDRDERLVEMDMLADDECKEIDTQWLIAESDRLQRTPEWFSQFTGLHRVK